MSSLCAFAAGALVPLLPWLPGGPNALGWSIGLTAAGLFSVGATLSLFTGRHAIHSGARMLALGALAGGITFGIGRLLGCVTARCHRPAEFRF